MDATIVLLGGDGIGPEIVAATRRLLDAVAKRHGHALRYDEQQIGGVAIDATGGPLPAATVEACLRADAVLLGAVGGPKWDDPRAPVRPEQGLLGIRKALGLYANLRPVRVYPALADASPLKAERLQGVDLLVVRELTGGLYFGQPRLRERREDGSERAVDTLEYTDVEIRRVVRLACQLAGQRRGHVTSVDKANVLESSRLWRQVAIEVAAEYPAIKLEHQLVDSAAMRLVTQPAAFDVIVTENMFGDILTDEAAVIGGSLGLLPSASTGEGRRGLYEPIHGSAPDIAGKGVANPLGTMLSAALLLRHSLGLEAEARAIEQAVERAINEGARTRDLGGTLGTSAMTEAVLARLD
ncbi:MAG: 3-isopropylmalate dehydrogenase [Proteobacteria bacterium]|nr:3-isopropylmalate dehydrogenase [Pseudomonadota bacterium]